MAAQTSRQQEAIERRKAQLRAERLERETAALAAHNARVRQAQEIQRTGLVPSVKRRVVTTHPVESSGQMRAWWSQPGPRALMNRQLAAYVKPPTAPYCPQCGGTRIRRQYQLDDDNGVVYECPYDWSQTILGTGCGHRWVFRPAIALTEWDVEDDEENAR